MGRSPDPVTLRVWEAAWFGDKQGLRQSPLHSCLTNVGEVLTASDGQGRWALAT